MDTININGKEVDLIYNGAPWATVGGRVEEFAVLIEKFGPVEAYNAVLEQYGADLADEVWAGVLVFVEYGFSAYYRADEDIKYMTADEAKATLLEIWGDE
jgi:hypothetical protein